MKCVDAERLNLVKVIYLLVGIVHVTEPIAHNLAEHVLDILLGLEGDLVVPLLLSGFFQFGHEPVGGLEDLSLEESRDLLINRGPLLLLWTVLQQHHHLTLLFYEQALFNNIELPAAHHQALNAVLRGLVQVGLPTP